VEVGSEQHFLATLPVDPVASTGSAGKYGRIPGGYFLCAGIVLESDWLAMGFPADAQIAISAKSAPKASLPGLFRLTFWPRFYHPRNYLRNQA